MKSWFQVNSTDLRIYADGTSANAKILVALNSVLMISTVISNGMFLIALFHKSSLHTASNILLGAVSLTDLFVGLIIEPIWIILLVKLIQNRFHSSLFAIQLLLINIFIGLSFVYVIAISCDRYFAICHPFKYLRYATSKKALKSSAILFLVCIGCSPVYVFVANKTIGTGLYIIGALAAATGFLLIVASNCRIFLVVVKQKCQVMARTNRVYARDENLANRERKRANVVALIVAVFIVCYLPSAIFHLYGALDENRQLNSSSLTVFIWFNFLMCVNSLANPLLYCYRVRSIRRAMIETIYTIKGRLFEHDF